MHGIGRVVLCRATRSPTTLPSTPRWVTLAGFTRGPTTLPPTLCGVTLVDATRRPMIFAPTMLLPALRWVVLIDTTRGPTTLLPALLRTRSRVPRGVCRGVLVGVTRIPTPSLLTTGRAVAGCTPVRYTRCTCRQSVGEGGEGEGNDGVCGVWVGRVWVGGWEALDGMGWCAERNHPLDHRRLYIERCALVFLAEEFF